MATDTDQCTIIDPIRQNNVRWRLVMRGSEHDKETSRSHV